MSTSYSPQIVTDGLVMYLDAGNTKSYIGSGTVWNDLSGNKKYGTLTNGPTYSNANKGHIVLDGIDDYIPIDGGTLNYSPGTTGELSLECLVYPTGPFTSYTAEPPITNLGCIFGQGYYGGYIGFGLGVVQKSSNYYWGFQVRNNTTLVDNAASPFTLNSWYHVSCTFTRNDFSRVYVNGALISSISTTALNGITITPNNNDAAIGKGGVFGFISGTKVAFAKLYNRPLSADEVKQNYNSTKGRYGL